MKKKKANTGIPVLAYVLIIRDENGINPNRRRWQ